jgi:hypothetical protein
VIFATFFFDLDIRNAPEIMAFQMQRFHYSALTSIIVVHYVFRLSAEQLTDYVCQADPCLIITVFFFTPT